MGQITRMDFLVWRLFVAHYPAVWRARRGTDEEELIKLRGFEELGATGFLLVENGSWFTEVDLGAYVATQ